MDPSGTIIAMLENGSTFEGLYSQISSFLLPFGDLTPLDSHHPSAVSTKKKPAQAQPKSGRRKKARDKEPEADSSGLRTLAKQYLPFLSRALNLLPTVIKKSHTGGEGEGGHGVIELFSSYRLVLDCLQFISPCLAGKPYYVHLQRVHLVYCLEVCGKYAEAEEEALSLLKSLVLTVSSDGALARRTQRGESGKGCCQYLSGPSGDYACDSQLAELFIEIVLILVGCTYKSKAKDASVYERVIILVEELQPWLRILNSDESERYQSVLVNSLQRCSFFLAKEAAYFENSLVGRFCMMQLRECSQSSLKDQFPKVVGRICSSFSRTWEGRHSIILEILRFSVEFVLHESKANLVPFLIDFFECVHCCVESYAHTSADIALSASKILFEGGSHFVEVLPTAASILSLYSTCLYILAGNNRIKNTRILSSCLDDGSAITDLMDEDWSPLLLSPFVICNFQILDNQDGECSTFPQKKFSFDQKIITARVFDCKDGELFFFSYLNALEFLCQLLEENVSRFWKQTNSQEEATYFSPKISYIHDTLLHFCNLYIITIRCAGISDKQRTRLHENCGTLLRAAVSSLRISFRTSKKQKESIACINNLISCKWIKSHELKFLISSIYNMGASLYNTKQVEKASAALQLSCVAAWAHVNLLCRMNSANPSDFHHVQLSEDVLKDVVAYACAKSCTTLDILYHCNIFNIHEFVAKVLSSWASARDMMDTLPTSGNLVKQWVKILCKDPKGDSAVDDIPLLYSLLVNCSPTLSKKTMGMLLEQELSAYEEMLGRNPKLSKIMQQKITDGLLCDVYVSKQYAIERAKILIRKGRFFRASGIEGLTTCIQCLSDAISLLSGVSDDSLENNILQHHLALAYCLRAQCIQEANHNLKAILDDVHSALRLWSKICSLIPPSIDNFFDLQTGNTIILLLNTIDLLSLKGLSDFQFEIHKLIILLFKQKSVSLDKCIAMLWSDRRLNHIFCLSSVNEDFILKTSKHFGLHTNSFDSWLSYFNDSQSSVVGFLQNFSISDSIISLIDSRNSKRSFGCKGTVTEVVATALSILSDVPLSSHSAFVASNLYYDLSERLLLVGRFSEALKYAREALHLRRNLLQRNFNYSVKVNSSETGKPCEATGDLVLFEAIGSVVTEVWPDRGEDHKFEQSVLSPWSILKCYLESTLQVGVIYEAVGDCLEAERYLQTGKKISVLQGLPVCEVYFASHLGQVYRKKKLWDLAENELSFAKATLHENDASVSCKCCKLFLNAIIEFQAGNLCRSSSKDNLQKGQRECISDALTLYKSSLKTLTHAKLGGTPCIYEDSRSINDDGKNLVINNIMSPFCHKCNQSSHDLSAQGVDINGARISCEPVVVGKHPLASRGHKKQVRTLPKKDQHLTPDSRLMQICTCDSICHKLCNSSNAKTEKFLRDNCWSCFLVRVAEFGAMLDIIHLKWECHQRRLMLKILCKIGKCTSISGGVHHVHDIFLRSMSLLFIRDPYNESQSVTPYKSFLEHIGDEFSGDIFTIERAEILHEMSCFYVKNCLSENSGLECCCFSKVQLATVVSWLLRAFMLSSEFPLLFKKVSQLLATLFLLSTVGSNYALPDHFNKSLSASHWAAFFHQASIGSYLHPQHILTCKEETCRQVGQCLSSSGSIDESSDTDNLPRIIPRNLAQLEEFVRDFYLCMPNFTVLCVSFLEGDYINILGEALLLTSFAPAWMLLSRFYSHGKPLAIFLPIDIVNEDVDKNHYSGIINGTKEHIKQWRCPWACNVVDNVAPQFKSMLEENFLSVSCIQPVDTEEERLRWWSRRKRLNDRLSTFLRSIEDSWFGPWKCLLQGDKSDPQNLESILKKLINDVKEKFELQADLSLLKAIVGGSQSLHEVEACVYQMLSYGGHFGRGESCGEGRFRSFSSSRDAVFKIISQDSCQLMLESIGEFVGESVDRKPLILVLDSDVQMLPWENLPILRKQEVYRMPSVSSIFATLTGSCHNKCMKATNSVCPSVDPLDAYYLLNPGGDLCSTQLEFEEWFRNQNWEGKAGNAPTIQELAGALQSHDLFIYFGHGSGTQYIPGYEIRKLRKCAATLLMGCSSGCLSVRGSYAPHGAPLFYLSAGSPVVIANLWEVTDRDIDRFSKAILSSWLNEESTSYVSCTCNVLKEFACLKVTNKGNSKHLKTRRNPPRCKKLQDVAPNDCRKCKFNHGILSFMSQARDACRLPILIGASPVCYGVPTVIRKNSKGE